MSAIQITCDRCGGRFIAGVVGRTAWPQHICPDGTTGAPASYGWRDEAVTEDEMVPLKPNSGHQYAEQATDAQRILLAKLCREDGIDPARLRIRTKAEAKMLLNYWLRGVGPICGWGFRDEQGEVKIQSRKAAT